MSIEDVYTELREGQCFLIIELDDGSVIDDIEVPPTICVQEGVES